MTSSTRPSKKATKGKATRAICTGKKLTRGNKRACFLGINKNNSASRCSYRSYLNSDLQTRTELVKREANMFPEGRSSVTHTPMRRTYGRR